MAKQLSQAMPREGWQNVKRSGQRWGVRLVGWDNWTSWSTRTKSWVCITHSVCSNDAACSFKLVSPHVRNKVPLFFFSADWYSERHGSCYCYRCYTGKKKVISSFQGKDLNVCKRDHLKLPNFLLLVLRLMELLRRSDPQS